MLRRDHLGRIFTTPMNLRFSLLFFVASSLLAPALHAQSPTSTPTVDELVAKNIEAKGGTAALSAIQSVRFEGKLLVDQGQVKLAYTQTKKRPGKVRVDAVLQGMMLVQAYDGTAGWKI